MEKRIIKKYSNRRLYDSKTSRTITLDDIAKFISNKEEIQVVDNKTGKDITNITLAQVILELEKSKKSEKQVADILRELIVSGSAAMADLAQKAVSESISVLSISKDKVKEAVNKMVEQGKVAKEQTNKIVEEIWSALKTSRKAFTKKIKELMEEKETEYVTKTELNKLKSKIDSIEKKMGDISKKSKKKKERNTKKKQKKKK
jgi:polyhydroxyalkanoate synthesis repressor PhaR